MSEPENIESIEIVKKEKKPRTEAQLEATRKLVEKNRLKKEQKKEQKKDEIVKECKKPELVEEVYIEPVAESKPEVVVEKVKKPRKPKEAKVVQNVIATKPEKVITIKPSFTPIRTINSM